MAASSKEPKEKNVQPLSEETLDEVTGGSWGGGPVPKIGDSKVSKPVTSRSTKLEIPIKGFPTEKTT